MSDRRPAVRPPPGGRPSAAPELRLEVHHAVEPVAQEWEELAGRVGASPFLRPGWVGAWWRAFGTGRLEIVALRRAGRLAALIPLHARFGRCWSASNWHTPQFGMVAEADSLRRELAAALFERGPVELSLAFVDAAGSDLAAVRAAAGDAGYRTLERTLQRSPFVVIEGAWDAYLRRLSRNRRSQVGRRRRRLEDQGRLVVELTGGAARLDDLLEEAFGVEASGWKGHNRSAIASRPETRRFYREIAQWAARRDWLRIAFLRLDHRPLAVQYLLEAKGTQYAIKGGYDPAFERYSPGIVLLQALLERAFATGLRRFCLGGTNDPYKTVFATGHEDYQRLQAFAPTPAGQLDRLAFTHGRPMAKRLLAMRGRGARLAHWSSGG